MALKSAVYFLPSLALLTWFFIFLVLQTINETIENDHEDSVAALGPFFHDASNCDQIFMLFTSEDQCSDKKLKTVFTFLGHIITRYANDNR